MSSGIIISDSLGSEAEDADAPERSIIYSWEDAVDHRFSEEVIVIDSVIIDDTIDDRHYSVAGEPVYETMRMFAESIDNLLESGRVVIGLLTRPRNLYATERETIGFTNYDWFPRAIGSIEAGPPEDDFTGFINRTPSAVEPWPVRTVRDERPFNTYFTNIQGTWVWLDVENSAVEDYQRISITSFEGDMEDELTGIAIESWRNQDDEHVEPAGTLVLLPRPDSFWFDVDEWFRSLLEIGYHYSTQQDDFDQFNRLLGRTTYRPLKDIYKICHKFPHAASSLDNRRGDREPLQIDDEYDLQYVFEALLRIEFDDVRPEEYGPSHAGSAPRIDFLIKGETIAVETKITRNGRGNEEIRTELAEDKEHYRAHPDCEYLVCYIYDPGHEIDNPAGFEADISEVTDNLVTEVLVSSTPRFTTP